MITKRKPRRKKKHHYKTGVHHSPKCSKPIHYRSNWEKVMAISLDQDLEVVEYVYEPFKIPYKSNKNCAKLKNYIPDFFVVYKDGHKVLLEVKRQDKLNDKVVLKKTEAGKAWCALQENTTYQLITEAVILPLMKLQKLQKKTKKK